jgi:hypothetical protein
MDEHEDFSSEARKLKIPFCAPLNTEYAAPGAKHEKLNIRTRSATTSAE